MKRMLTALLLCIVAASWAAADEPFVLAWSEYPSWSVFGVAGEVREGGKPLLDGRAGQRGIIEERWNVDIELKELDYDSCLVLYGAAKCDIVCITNMDVLNPSLSIKSVVIGPTSTSFGADACIVSRAITDVADLKGKSVYGLAKTVSEYCWARNLTMLKQDEKDYKFVNMDPAAAATAFQQGRAGFDAIIVWNPFVMETLNKRKDAHVLFDSTTIPGEIIDMLVMSEASLKRPGGDRAACAALDAYYTVCRRLADKQLQDDTLVALGEKFSHLSAAAMKTVVRQTRFYATPEQGLALMTGGVVFPWTRTVAETSDLFTNAGFQPEKTDVTDKTLKQIMPIVADFCVAKEITPKKPEIGYGTQAEAPEAQLRFDPTWIREVAAKK